MSENTKRNLNEYAPTIVENSVNITEIQQHRIDREITAEIADATRVFNKILGKLSKDEAYGVFEQIDFKHYLSYETVINAVNVSFENQPERFYRTDGIVARLQVKLDERGYKITQW